MSKLKTTEERRTELRAWALRNQYYPVATLIDDIGTLSAEVARLEALTGKLAEALKHAKSKINDMQILFKEAAELEGLTVFVCGDKFNPQEIDAALTAWEARSTVEREGAQHG